MAKLTRITGKLFGETATATGDNPQIGQFGSGLAGTYVGTTDVATIQNLTAWSNGFIGCVTPDTQYPPLPEMTGFGKVLSYQQNYLLQQGVAEWDNATTYYINSYVSYNGKIYISLTDNNLNHNPATSTTNWAIYGKDIYSNIDLSNLSNNGNNRLHALKGYLDDGTALTDAEGLADVITYAHSTFDVSKFTVVGTPTISADGIVSNISSNGTARIADTYVDFSASNWSISIGFTYAASTSDMLLIGRAASSYMFALNVKNNKVKLFASSNGTSWDIANNEGTTALTANHFYIATLIRTAGTSYSLILRDLDTGTSSTELTISSSADINYPSGNLVIGSATGWGAFNGTIDLKCIQITVNNAVTFSGTLTGSDTYTISGNSVTIPYNLSKTGAKIVDSAYRTDVTAVYNQQGYSPYYTLDEVNGNFTLPQGEIYGMMLNQSVPHVIESYQNGTSGYVVYSNGYCEQWGRGVTDNDGWCAVSLLKAYRDTNYIPIANQCYGTYETPSIMNADIVSTDDMRTTAFRALCSTNADTPPAVGTGIAWITRGYINL